MFLNDFNRIKKLGRYLTKDKKTIYLIRISLLPVSFAGAIQPLLVGQAITILKNESTDVWLSKTFFGQSINSISNLELKILCEKKWIYDYYSFT